MTDLGKVFVMIVTILSAGFLTLSMVVNASHVNHRSLAQKLEEENRQLSRNVTELKTAIEKGQTELAHEQAARRQALAALQSQNNTLITDLSTNEAALARLQSQNTLMNQTLNQTQAELQRVTQENENIRQQIATTLQDRNELRSKVIARTDELYNLTSLLKDSQDRVKQLQSEVTILQARNNTAAAALASAGLSENPDDVPPSDIKGVITAVSGNSLVEISLGRDDGLRAGHQLEVYRGSQYLGRIRIQRVDDDKAIGEVLPSFRKGFIQQNDTVAAKLG